METKEINIRQLLVTIAVEEIIVGEIGSAETVDIFAIKQLATDKNYSKKICNAVNYAKEELAELFGDD